MTTSDAITRNDLDKAFDQFYVRVEKMVGTIVGEIVGDALILINERFDRLEAQMARMAGEIENLKDRVDHHDIDIRQLKRKTV